MRCFLPRIILSIILSTTGYYGPGGDAQMYHVTGVYAKDLFFKADTASFRDVIYRWGWDEPEEELDSKYSAVISDFELKGGYSGNYISDTAPIVLLHALLYSIWENPFLYVFFTSAFSALATSFFVNSYEIRPKDRFWFIYTF